MKKSVACLAVALAVGCARVPAAPEKKAISVETLRAESVAFVRQPRGFAALFSGGQLRPFCSGVWVSSSSVLTANHCVDQENDAEEVMKDYLVTTPNDVQDPQTGRQFHNVQSYVASVYARDFAHDLALVRVSSPPDHASPDVASGTVLVGQRVANLGNPLGQWFSFATGDVAAVREMELANDAPLPAFVIQTTTPTSPGNSGGGLFNEAGELVGVCHAGVRGGQNISFYIDTRYIRTFLDAQGARL